jgi:hypothetical protein
MSSTPQTHDTATRHLRPWTAPTVRSVGRLGEVLKGGQGKLTVLTGDPGEPQKVPAQEN